MKTVPAIVQLLFAAALIGRGCMADDVQTVEDFNRLLVGSDLSNDFENGILGLWNNTGLGSVRWQVEDNFTLIEPGYAAPEPGPGAKYLRINHLTPGLTAGLAVLKSPLFTAQPGDLVSFSFWIRSKNYAGNSLVLYYVEGTTDNPLANLTEYSSLGNNEWRSYSVQFPFDAPRNISLKFHGVIRNNAEDAIALDNIYVGGEQTTTTTPMPENPDCTILTSPYGVIKSKYFPNSYNDSSDECWLIRAPNGSAISLSFNSFDVAAILDDVRIYDGANSSTPLLLAASNGAPQGLPPSVFSSSNEMYVNFSAQDNAAGAKGFVATYFQTAPSPPPPPDKLKPAGNLTLCGGNLWGTLRVESPDYPNAYPNNTDCYWYCTGLPSNSMKINLTAFDLEPNNDYLTFYNGLDLLSEQTLQLSGSLNDTNLSVVADTKTMLLHFHSSRATSRSGFRLSYEKADVSSHQDQFTTI